MDVKERAESRMKVLIRILTSCMLLVFVGLYCSGCIKPPAQSQDDGESQTSERSAILPREYYEGYWVCCGYKRNGTVFSYNTLSQEERGLFPHLVLRLGDNGIGDVMFCELRSPLPYSDSIYLILSGEWDVIDDGVRIDEVSLGGSDIIDFVLVEGLLALPNDGVNAIERHTRLWCGESFEMPQSDAVFYFEKLDFSSQLQVGTIEFDGITIDVPIDVTYYYNWIRQEGENSATARSFRDMEGPWMTLRSTPTEARDIIELAGDNYGGNEDSFIEYNGITFCIYHYEGKSMRSTLLQFVVNGKAYSIDFNYDPVLDPVDYSDYENYLFTAIGTGSGTRAGGVSYGLSSGALPWQEAQQHVGETVTVCGPVAETEYANTSDGQPAFIDLGVAYPDERRVTLVIWGEDRNAFPEPPETMYAGTTICVTGEPYIYEGVCYIRVTSPSQVQIV